MRTGRVVNAVLIETLWNVNQHSCQNSLNFSEVLIETLWNVNLPEQLKALVRKYVLIETLWNVNETFLRAYVEEDEY